MRKCTAAVMVLAAATLFYSCAATCPEPRAEAPVQRAEPGAGQWAAGTVRFHDAGVAIGGETDPHGFILEGDHGLERLYLRHDGSLLSPAVRAYEDQRVEVRGRMGVITAGGVETPLRRFPVLEIVEIRPARR